MIVWMKKYCEVYVALIGEGTIVWRSVEAEPISGELFRLLGSIPDGETWQFQPGDLVSCERRTFANETESLVAVRKN